MTSRQSPSIIFYRFLIVFSVRSESLDTDVLFDDSFEVGS